VSRPFTPKVKVAITLNPSKVQDTSAILANFGLSKVHIEAASKAG
jgi:hypothetical protein